MRQIIPTLLIIVFALSGCSIKAQDVIVTYSGNGAEVTLAGNDSVSVKIDGAYVELDSKYASRELGITMQGKSDDGRLVLKSQGKVKIKLNNLSLSSNSGAPIWLKNKKRVEIVAPKNSHNSLCVAAITDTATQKQAVIWAKNKLTFSGKGSIDVLAKADGCKGINVKDDIKISDLTLSVVTEGNNLGKDTTSPFGFGGMPPFGEMPEGGFPGFGEGGFPPMGQMPEGGFPPMGQMPEGGMPPFGQMPEGGFPPMGQMPEGGFPGFGEGGFPGFGGPMGPSGDPDEKIKNEFKQRYIAKTKGIRATGTITINSGKVYCKTSSQGAEGIEGKKGVTINGGVVAVDAVDDAINSNGQIIVTGGVVTAESHCNDAIDSNCGGMFPPAGGFGAPMGGPMGGGFGGPMGAPADSLARNGMPPQPKDQKEPKQPKPQEPAFVISGGEVYALSHVGVPEEGMDCDFAPFHISGGTIFTMGAGMGEMPSVPTNETAKQPIVLFTNITLAKGEKFEVLDGSKTIYSKEIPFSFNGSATLFTCPKLKKNKTYTLRVKDDLREFATSENFVVCRKK